VAVHASSAVIRCAVELASDVEGRRLVPASTVFADVGG
jgi:hypothetical protein